jgi:thioredoxin-like negative regulator of GroEL
MAVEQKGIDAKVLSGDSVNRLVAMTKGQMASEGTMLAAANKASTGDALVKAGEDLWGQGKFKEAVDAIKAGIAKGKADMDEANLRLGMAYLGAGQKDAAQHAFAQVKTDPKQAMIARLWALYARK